MSGNAQGHEGNTHVITSTMCTIFRITAAIANQHCRSCGYIVCTCDLRCCTPSHFYALCGCSVTCACINTLLGFAAVDKFTKHACVLVKNSKPPEGAFVCVLHVLLSCRHNCSRNTCSQWPRRKGIAKRKQKNRLPEYNVLLRGWGHLRRLNKASHHQVL